MSSNPFPLAAEDEQANMQPQAPSNTQVIMSSVPPFIYPQETSYSNADDFITGVLSNLQTKDRLPTGPPPVELVTPDQYPSLAESAEILRKTVTLNINSEPFIPSTTVPPPAAAVIEGPAFPKKTMYIQQKNKDYDRMDAKKGVTYRSSYERLRREMTYFTKILTVTDEDFRETEEDIAEKVLLDKRAQMKKHLEELKMKIDEFVTVNLDGEVRKKTVRPPPVEDPKEVVEYTQPYDRKPAIGGTELQLHKCIDCDTLVDVIKGKSVEEALLEHAQSAHSSAPVQADPLDNAKPSNKKSDAAYKKLCTMHRLFNNDSGMYCQVCNVNLADDADVYSHTETVEHCNTLNRFNAADQRVIIQQNAHLFGPGKLFDNLTNQHINVHKIFVNPMLKLIMCGTCRKQLPFSPNHISIHVQSAKHTSQLTPEELESLTKCEEAVEAETKTKSYASLNYPKVYSQHLFRIINAVESNKDRYECMLCPETVLGDAEQVEEHERTARHQEMMRDLENAFANGRKEKKGRKIRINLNKNIKGNYWCPHCRLSFPDVAAVFDHMDLEGGHHMDSILGVWISRNGRSRIYQCDQCDLTFLGDDNAITHIEMHAEVLVAAEKNTRTPKKNETKHQEQITKNWRETTPLDPALLEVNFIFGKQDQYQCAACNMGVMTDNEVTYHLSDYMHKSRLTSLRK